MRYSRANAISLLTIFGAAAPSLGLVAPGGVLAAADHGHSGAQSREFFSLAGREEETTCGEGVGSCPPGLCCNGFGFCGAGTDYCKSPQCQIQYSEENCDGSKKPCGSSTADVPRNNVGPAPYGIYIQSCQREGTIALTFDDGPSEFTDDLLDKLAARGHKVTFFVTGFNNGKNPIDTPDSEELLAIRRAHADGHQLGSHTWSHQQLSEASPEVREQQIIYNEMAFRNIFGFFPKYLRPPYGSCSIDSGCMDYVTQLGYHVIRWDADTEDWKNSTPEKIQTSKDKFLAGAFAGNDAIVISHDTYYQTVYNLTDFMLDELEARGLTSTTIGDCLGDPSENWYTNAVGGEDADEERTPCGAPPPPDYGVCLPLPSPIPGTDLFTSTDGTCGFRSSNIYGCSDSSYGDCCSYNGYCGSDSAHCDGGCESRFGSCNEVNPGDPLIISENGLCGGDTHQTCLDSGFGDCCSKYGFCGETDEYCSLQDDCQAAFGTCS